MERATPCTGAPPATLDVVAGAAAATGLVVRGAFHPLAADAVPDAAPGAPAATLVLLGNAGAAMWRAFRASPEFARKRDPLDAWSRRVVTALAVRLGAHPLFPFGGPPWLPFQRWAVRAGPLHPSPIGPLIHPEYGLWHAYRGALAFTGPMPLPAPRRGGSPCATCRERPCLDTCPVGAFDGAGYDVPACTAHIDSPAGSECLGGGCLARRACPAGRAFHYEPEQAGFHMAAFLRANRARKRRRTP